MSQAMCTSKACNSNNKFCHKQQIIPHEQDTMQGTLLSAEQKLGVSFFKSQIYSYVLYIHKIHVLTPGWKTSLMLAAYIKYNSDLTRKLSRRMLWPWGVQQTCPVEYNTLWNIIWNIIYKDMDISKVRLKTPEEFWETIYFNLVPL